MISLVLLAGAIAEVVFDDSPWPAAHLALSVLTFALLPYRRQFTLRVATIVFVGEFALTVVAWSADVDLETRGPQGIAFLMIVYAVCRWPVARDAALGLATIILLVFVGSFSSGDSVLSNVAALIPWVFVAGFALAMRYRARLAEVERQSVRLSERNTLARELHDSVAHHVSAIAVQAQAARFVASSDPDAAVDAIAAIEETANTAIDEMRRMVGILRSDDDEARTVAATSLASLARPDGRPRVVLVGAAELGTLPTAVAAAVFRIAQESVTNATRHSDGVTFVDIKVVIDSDEVRLEVVNDGNPTTKNSGSGFGSIGMRERVDALHGTLEAGPRSNSGWRVAAVLPVGRHE